MPVIVQVCVVIVTIAIIALVVGLVRMAGRLSKLAEDIRTCLVEVREVTGEARGVVAKAREMLQPVQRMIDRFERIGTRTAAVSSAFLEEVEAPVRTAIAIVRGPHLGAGQESVQQMVERLLVAVAVVFGVSRILVFHGCRQHRDVFRGCRLNTVTHGGLRSGGRETQQIGRQKRCV